MDDGKILIVWQGKVSHGRQTSCRLETTVPGVLEALRLIGKPPECFNKMITSVLVSKHGGTVLFVKGSYFGRIDIVLRDHGLGRRVWLSG